MTTPERTVEEIVEESKKCLIKVGSENHLDLSCIREIIEAERQRCEEMVEVTIKETVQYIDKFESFEFASAESYVEKLVALSHPNNPE